VYFDQFDTIKAGIQNKLGTKEDLTDGQKEEINTKVTGAETFMEGVKAHKNAK